MTEKDMTTGSANGNTGGRNGYADNCKDGCGNRCIENLNGSNDMTELIPLSELGARQQAEIRFFNGGRVFRERLHSMGLRQNSHVTVLNNSKLLGGPVLLAAGAARVSVGRRMARKIMVKPLKN